MQTIQAVRCLKCGELHEIDSLKYVVFNGTVTSKKSSENSIISMLDSDNKDIVLCLKCLVLEICEVYNEYLDTNFIIAPFDKVDIKNMFINQAVYRK